MKIVIGISGLAGDGKDSVCKILEDFCLKKTKYEFKRIALADKLKEKCQSACVEMFGIDPVSCSREDKNKIRDFLVFYGKIMRNETSGTYWTNIVQKEINSHKSKNIIFCIPDIRYAYFEKDEVFWLKSFKNSRLIHVKKHFSQIIEKNNRLELIKSYSDAVNKDEAENCPKLENLASHIIDWQNFHPYMPEENDHCIRAVHSVARDIFDSLKVTI